MPPRRGNPSPSKTTPTRPYMPFQAGCGTSTFELSCPSLLEKVQVDSISLPAFGAKKSGKRKWTSLVWKQFNVHNGELLEDGKHRALCKYCKGGPVLAPSNKDAYLDAGRMDHTQKLDVLNWWKENASKFPIVSQMAKDILAIPITTVASESAFSMGSRVLTKWRSALDPDTTGNTRS